MLSIISINIFPSDTIVTTDDFTMLFVEIVAFHTAAYRAHRFFGFVFFLFSGVFRVCKCHHNTFLQISAGKLSPFKYQQFHQGSYCHSPLFSKGSPSTRLICIVPVQFSIAFPSCFCYSVSEYLSIPPRRATAKGDFLFLRQFPAVKHITDCKGNHRAGNQIKHHPAVGILQNPY